MRIATEIDLPPKRIDRATVPGAPWQSVRLVNEAVRKAIRWVRPLRNEIQRVVVGQECLVSRLLICLLADGHLLLEGGPGLAKSRTLKALALGMDAGYRRIPLTPDMVPANLTEGLILDPDGGSSETDPGPIFANLIVAEDIHRAPPMVQNALLSAMEEREVTVAHVPHCLPDPFLVVATVNPAAGDAHHPLTESQADRFLMKLVLDYPSREEEREIIDVAGSRHRGPLARSVLSKEDLLRARRVVASVYADQMIKDYAVALVSATRGPKVARTVRFGPWAVESAKLEASGGSPASMIRRGASPRATVDLIRAAKACAFLAGRGYLTPRDVKAVATDVLRHRLTLRSRAVKAGITTGDVIRHILDTVAVP